MNHLHSLAAAYNARIAGSNRAGEIEWVVTGAGLKLVHTDRFERENGLLIKSRATDEQRRAARRHGEADFEARRAPAEQENFL